MGRPLLSSELPIRVVNSRVDCHPRSKYTLVLPCRVERSFIQRDHELLMKRLTVSAALLLLQLPIVCRMLVGGNRRAIYVSLVAYLVTSKEYDVSVGLLLLPDAS